MNEDTEVARLLADLRRRESRLEEKRDDDAVVNLLRSILTVEAASVAVSVTVGSAAAMRVAASARSPQQEREVAFSEVADTTTP